MGTVGKSSTLEWQKENMIAKNIFRLNWHKLRETGVKSSIELPEDKNYLELIVEKTMKP
jgi:hypothetical protein